MLYTVFGKCTEKSFEDPAFKDICLDGITNTVDQILLYNVQKMCVKCVFSTHLPKKCPIYCKCEYTWNAQYKRNVIHFASYVQGYKLYREKRLKKINKQKKTPFYVMPAMALKKLLFIY